MFVALFVALVAIGSDGANIGDARKESDLGKSTVQFMMDMANQGKWLMDQHHGELKMAKREGYWPDIVSTGLSMAGHGMNAVLIY